MQNHPKYDHEGRGGVELPLRRTRFDMNTGLSPNAPRQQVGHMYSGKICVETDIVTEYIVRLS